MRRRALLGLLTMPMVAAADSPGERYSSEAMRRRAADQARQRAEWWERQRQRQEAERVDRELERRRDTTGWQIERWEEQNARRRWGRTSP
jgi:hypothetical protein